MKYATILLWLGVSIFGQKATAQSHLLEELMQTQPEKFSKILENLPNNELQIIYTEIKREGPKVSFKSHQFNVNDQAYFYPASTIKLPACVWALEKLNRLNIKGLDMNSSMKTLNNGHGQSAVDMDSSSKNGMPSVAHYIKKILLVSDNDAFNRLYEFIGQEEFNRKMKKHGLKNSYAIHRLQTSLSFEDHKYTNPVNFYNGANVIYAQGPQYSRKNFHGKKKILKGIGYLNAKDSLIMEPFDFTRKNKFTLTDQQYLLKALFFPESIKKRHRLKITETDRKFLMEYMSKIPTESSFPHYHYPEYWPSYCKFLMYGSEKEAEIPNYIKIYNKVGDAYGYLIDNAYIKDEKNGLEFMLSAMIHCNADKIYNDGKYEYDGVGFPFMRDLGQLIYNHELKKIPQKK